MTHWHGTGAGCVTIWPVTVPKYPNHREVALLALPKEDRLNPCKEAQEFDDVEVDRFDSVVSVFCMTTRVINTPSMKYGNCMCH